MQTPTTIHIAHHHSLHDIENRHEQGSTLLILPELASSPGLSSDDSIQQPSERPLYMRLAEDRSDWRASGILHDFNNQLAIILSHCSIALTKLPADSNARANLERSVRATKRAADLSSQLQVGISAQEEEMVPVNLNELVEEALAALEPRITAQASIETSYASDLPEIVVNPRLIHRMLLNIMLNGVEAIQDNAGQISIMTESVTVSEMLQQGYQKNIPLGHYVAIQVSDTGCGMDQTTLNKIFSPYYSTKAIGMGLGLTMALHVMQLHKGIIQVRSTPNYGTVFRLLLPV